MLDEQVSENFWTYDLYICYIFIRSFLFFEQLRCSAFPCESAYVCVGVDVYTHVYLKLCQRLNLCLAI